MVLEVKPKSGCRWDVVSLGEVMLRLDPGEGRVHTTRTFQVWEGGGEYNVARGLKRCFGLDAAVVTALADNPVGRLVQDLIFQGGVDQSHVIWRKYDGVGREVRNGLNFTERGFGVRAALGCSDRGHTAVSQLKPGDIDWEQVFGREGARWFHTGGIFCALSETTPAVAREAIEGAELLLERRLVVEAGRLPVERVPGRRFEAAFSCRHREASGVKRQARRATKDRGEVVTPHP